MKLLLTAFDPFGGEPVNPALEAVKLVSDTVGSVQVVKLEVPTVFGKSIDKVAKAIEAEREVEKLKKIYISMLSVQNSEVAA